MDETNYEAEYQNESKTHDKMNPLSKAKLKERMNFSKMFERQEKQIKQTAHINNLLTPSHTEDVINKDSAPISQEHHALKSRIEKLEDHFNMHEIYNRFDKLEDNINTIKAPRNIKLKLEIKNKRHAYFIAATALACTILLSLMIRPATEIKYQDKIVYKDAPKAKLFVMTKYVNIRTHASTSSNKITTLAPNSLVEIIQVQKDWKKIKFKNHVTGKTLTGWAYGENLKLVK